MPFAGSEGQDAGSDPGAACDDDDASRATGESCADVWSVASCQPSVPGGHRGGGDDALDSGRVGQAALPGDDARKREAIGERSTVTWWVRPRERREGVVVVGAKVACKRGKGSGDLPGAFAGDPGARERDHPLIETGRRGAAVQRLDKLGLPSGEPCATISRHGPCVGDPRPR